MIYAYNIKFSILTIFKYNSVEWITFLICKHHRYFQNVFINKSERVEVKTWGLNVKLGLLFIIQRAVKILRRRLKDFKKKHGRSDFQFEMTVPAVVEVHLENRWSTEVMLLWCEHRISCWAAPHSWTPPRPCKRPDNVLTGLYKLCAGIFFFFFSEGKTSAAPILQDLDLPLILNSKLPGWTFKSLLSNWGKPLLRVLEELSHMF